MGKSEDELRRAFRPLRGSEDFEECEGEEEEEAELQEPMLPEDLLRLCGCNLGNVLFHPQSSAVVSIDTCVITGAPNDYPNKLLALIEEVVRAQEANAECDGLRVTRAVLTAALRLDDATRPGGSCSLLEQSALLQLGFLEGIEKAAQRLGPKELGGLIKRTRAHAELRGEEEASPLLPMSAADGLTRQLEEARKLVERTVAACATRQERVRALPAGEQRLRCSRCQGVDSANEREGGDSVEGVFTAIHSIHAPRAPRSPALHVHSLSPTGSTRKVPNSVARINSPHGERAYITLTVLLLLPPPLFSSGRGSLRRHIRRRIRPFARPARPHSRAAAGSARSP